MGKWLFLKRWRPRISMKNILHWPKLFCFLRSVLCCTYFHIRPKTCNFLHSIQPPEVSLVFWESQPERQTSWACTFARSQLLPGVAISSPPSGPGWHDIEISGSNKSNRTCPRSDQTPHAWARWTVPPPPFKLSSCAFFYFTYLTCT